nr:hypothetical protein L203_00659 [Cryptococcus depauperatus CBS 7841]
MIVAQHAVPALAYIDVGSCQWSLEEVMGGKGEGISDVVSAPVASSGHCPSLVSLLLWAAGKKTRIRILNVFSGRGLTALEVEATGARGMCQVSERWNYSMEYSQAWILIIANIHDNTVYGEEWYKQTRYKEGIVVDSSPRNQSDSCLHLFEIDTPTYSTSPKHSQAKPKNNLIPDSLTLVDTTANVSKHILLSGLGDSGGYSAYAVGTRHYLVVGF